MFRSNKYTRQVLFACLFTVCFFVGYAALATVMRLWLVPAGFVACTAFEAVLLAAFGAVVRKGTRAMKGVTAEDGIVIYPDLLSFSAACTAVWILIFADASSFSAGLFRLHRGLRALLHDSGLQLQPRRRSFAGVSRTVCISCGGPVSGCLRRVHDVWATSRFAHGDPLQSKK